MCSVLRLGVRSGFLEVLTKDCQYPYDDFDGLIPSHLLVRRD
jgi:hypothetical protein